MCAGAWGRAREAYGEHVEASPGRRGEWGARRPSTSYTAEAQVEAREVRELCEVPLCEVRELRYI